MIMPVYNGSTAIDRHIMRSLMRRSPIADPTWKFDREPMTRQMYHAGKRVWNPLLKLPRNGGCMCGSGRKFKHCHLDEVDALVTKEEAAKNRKVLEVARQLHSARK